MRKLQNLAMTGKVTFGTSSRRFPGLEPNRERGLSPNMDSYRINNAGADITSDITVK